MAGWARLHQHVLVTLEGTADLVDADLSAFPAVSLEGLNGGERGAEPLIVFGLEAQVSRIHGTRYLVAYPARSFGAPEYVGIVVTEPKSPVDPLLRVVNGEVDERPPKPPTKAMGWSAVRKRHGLSVPSRAEWLRYEYPGHSDASSAPAGWWLSIPPGWNGPHES